MVDDFPFPMGLWTCFVEGDGLQKPDRFLRIRTASLAAACHFAIWSLDGKHYDMSWWVLFFFFNLVFLGNDKKGVLKSKQVFKGMGYLGCRSLFGTLSELLMYFLVFMYLGAFVCTENFDLMNGLGLFLCTYQDCCRVTCTLWEQQLNQHLFIWPDNSNRLWESAVQTIVEAYFLSLFLVIGVFWSWWFIP